MEMTDTRLSADEKEMLSLMVGESLDSYSVDEPLVNQVTFMSAWLQVAGSTYEVRNSVEPLAFFGALEDVAVLSVRKSVSDEVHSRLPGHSLINRFIGRTIQDILVYEDTQSCAKNGTDIYAYSFTAAIAFILDGSELVFEKPVWFSEDIKVLRGPGSSGKIYMPETMLEESETSECTYRAGREVLHLKEWQQA